MRLVKKNRFTFLSLPKELLLLKSQTITNRFHLAELKSQSKTKLLKI